MNDTLEQLDEVTAMIAEARDAVAADEIVDLSEIQARVQNICLEIQDTPPESSQSVEGKITSMISDLNALAKELEAQQRSLGSDVVRNAVRDAYNKPNGDN
jgi:cob(I)alamin adenosyltransferase